MKIRLSLFSVPLLIMTLYPVSALSAETWRFTANTVKSIQREGEIQTSLEGQARIQSEDLIIEAESIELIGSEYDLIRGNGSISVIDIDDGINIQSNSFNYEQQSDIIRFQGMVTLLDDEEGIIIRCEFLDFYQEDDYAVMQSAVRLIKDDDNMIGRGEFAKYFRDTEILELSGHSVVWKDDDQYKADRIRVNLDTDEITMDGTVKGKLVTEDDDEKEEQP